MRENVTKFAALMATLLLASSVQADPISPSYTVFGGYTSSTTSSPPTADMGTVVTNGQSATLTTNSSDAEVGALYMDTGINTTASYLTMAFDVNVLSQAASGYGQNFGGTETLGGIRIWDATVGNWEYSFQFIPTSATTGYFAFRDATNSSVLSIATYDTNTIYHVLLTADYSTHMATASIDGATPISYALRPGTAPGDTTSEIFFYMNGVTGAENSIQIGAPVPLPSAASLGFVSLAALGLGQLIRNRSKGNTTRA
ncbi:MAG TPA: hypothetical protein VFE58_05000 [Tepidisphaeraceae bacterium]|jgi:hypothetical protein|nr:hypothetical protein [Tepidisphaeraceae bacterium]